MLRGNWTILVTQVELRSKARWHIRSPSARFHRLMSGGWVRAVIILWFAATFSVIACQRAFVDRSRCAQDLRDYEDRIRIERDTSKQSRLIAEADSDAVLAGRGARQRTEIHNLLA